MGTVHEFEKEKLIIGIIYSDDKKFEEAKAALVERFGEIDDECEKFSFSEDFSTYYDDELGGEGKRIIYSFKEHVDASLQAEIKEFTNELELRLADDGKRRVNIDPGFLNHGRLMLATTKAVGFRIPLKRGIYTELTLFYARGEFHSLPWTYMDYKSELVQKFLLRVRKRYLAERKMQLKH